VLGRRRDLLARVLVLDRRDLLPRVWRLVLGSSSVWRLVLGRRGLLHRLRSIVGIRRDLVMGELLLLWGWGLLLKVAWISIRHLLSCKRLRGRCSWHWTCIAVEKSKVSNASKLTKVCKRRLTWL
jgi:hypothetical protein